MPFLLGVAGGSGSGKSRLAQAVVDHLGPDHCVHLMHDDYYRSLPAHLAGRPEDVNFDAPDALESSLLAAHLHALRAGRTVDVPEYDFTTHRRAGSRAVAPRPIVVVEGILLLATPHVRSALDLGVFVHCAADIRLERRMFRDVRERGRDAAWVRARFERFVAPMHEQHVEPSRAHAGLVVDGTGDLNANVTAVLDRLPDRLS